MLGIIQDVNFYFIIKNYIQKIVTLEDDSITFT